MPDLNDEDKKFIERFHEKHLFEVYNNLRYFIKNNITHILYLEKDRLCFSQINKDFSIMDGEDKNGLLKKNYVAEYDHPYAIRELLEEVFYQEGVGTVFVFGEENEAIKEAARINGLIKMRLSKSESDQFTHTRIELVDIVKGSDKPN